MRLRSVLLAAVAAAVGDVAAAQDPFNVEVAAAVCVSCHGEDGVPIEPDYPVIWGQQFYYMYVQLRDYNSGLRTNEIMGPQVADFDRDQMKALATYFSEKPWPAIPHERDTAKVAQGEMAAGSGECSQCHNTFMGDSRVPRLAGQQQAYLARTMHEYKNKIRNNDPTMGSLMQTFDDADLDALADFLATRG
jgi:cytochrome c553